MGAEVKSVGAGPHGSQVEEDAEAKRDALLNAEEDASDEEEAALKREAPVNSGHIVTWGVPVSVEAVCACHSNPGRAAPFGSRVRLFHPTIAPTWRRRSER